MPSDWRCRRRRRGRTSCSPSSSSGARAAAAERPSDLCIRRSDPRRARAARRTARGNENRAHGRVPLNGRPDSYRASQDRARGFTAQSFRATFFRLLPIARRRRRRRARRRGDGRRRHIASSVDDDRPASARSDVGVPSSARVSANASDGRARRATARAERRGRRAEAASKSVRPPARRGFALSFGHETAVLGFAVLARRRNCRRRDLRIEDGDERCGRVSGAGQARRRRRPQAAHLVRRAGLTDGHLRGQRPSLVDGVGEAVARGRQDPSRLRLRSRRQRLERPGVGRSQRLRFRRGGSRRAHRIRREAALRARRTLRRRRPRARLSGGASGRCRRCSCSSTRRRRRC